MDDAALEQRAARIEADGYTILKGVIAPDLVDAIGERLASLERELGTEPAGNAFEGDHTLRVYNLLVHGQVFSQIPTHPGVLPLVKRVLGKGCLISSLSSIHLLPGETPQPLHADDQMIPLAKPHVPLVCNTMWAITDFTADNGATLLAPGSHKLDRDPAPGGEDVPLVKAEMPRGSVLVWVGSLWHAGGANETSSGRVGIAMNYCAGFVRQQENQQLGVPQEVAKTFDPELQRLMGYSVYRGLIGHIDKRDPIALLGNGDAHTMLWDRKR